MTITGNLADGINITFTDSERAVLVRALKRLKRTSPTGMTLAQLAEAKVRNFFTNWVQDERGVERRVALTDEEQASVDAIYTAAAERDANA